MTSDAKLILKQRARAERWEDQERAEYSIDSFRTEFRERLYSKVARETLKPDSAEANRRDQDSK
jgi:hypothetical protein